MSRKTFYLISILSFLLALQACGHRETSVDSAKLGDPVEVQKDRANFELRLKRAQYVLGSKASGKKVLNETSYKNTYNAPIEIVAITPTELKSYNLGGLSGI